MSKTKPAPAKWVPCPGMKEGAYLHAMRDHCHSCAPWWETVAVCPSCGHRMPKMGTQQCKHCKEWVRA